MPALLPSDADSHILAKTSDLFAFVSGVGWRTVQPIPRARKHLVGVSAMPCYHITSRCVRRAFLCGVDQHTGNSCEYRRAWIEERPHVIVPVPRKPLIPGAAAIAIALGCRSWLGSVSCTLRLKDFRSRRTTSASAEVGPASMPIISECLLQASPLVVLSAAKNCGRTAGRSQGHAHMACSQTRWNPYM